MRQTSIEAFAAVQESGFLGATQKAVYNLLFKEGPLTGQEVDNKLAAPGETQASYHKRLSELKTAGVIVEVGERTCSITGMNAIIWDVTAKAPEKRHVRLTKLGSYRILTKELIDYLYKKGMSEEADTIKSLVDGIEHV